MFDTLNLTKLVDGFMKIWSEIMNLEYMKINHPEIIQEIQEYISSNINNRLRHLRQEQDQLMNEHDVYSKSRGIFSERHLKQLHLLQDFP
jgi:hypothetical protein